MTVNEAIELVIERTGVERYRWLCSEENCLDSPNDRETWRAWIVEQVQTDFPSLPEQAANFVGAVGRIVGAAVTGQRIRVSPEERDERKALCRACENLINNRCKLCGCHFLGKIEFATESCPIDKW